MFNPKTHPETPSDSLKIYLGGTLAFLLFYGLLWLVMSLDVLLNFA